MVVQLLWIYNHKHRWTWDEILPYIKHIYNRAQHIETGKSSFSLCFGFQPSVPIDLVSRPTVSTDSDHEQREIDKAVKFNDKICEIQKQAQKMLQRSSEKAKARHDKHHVPHSFQIGDQV